MAETLTFTTGSSTASGTLSYNSATMTLSGTAINIGSLDAVAPVNAGTYNVNGAIPCNNTGNPPNGGNGTCASLNFTTGTLSSAQIVNFGAPNQFMLLEFNAGGNLSLTGNVPLVTPGPGLVTNGVFNTLVPTLSVILTGTSTLVSTTGFGSDLKDGAMVSFFGLQNPFEFTLALNGTAPTPFPATGTFPPTKPASFTSSVTGTTFTNTEVVPEPASVVLLGLVLLGCGAITRRRLANV